MSSTK